MQKIYFEKIGFSENNGDMTKVFTDVDEINDFFEHDVDVQTEIKSMESPVLEIALTVEGDEVIGSSYGYGDGESDDFDYVELNDVVSWLLQEPREQKEDCGYVGCKNKAVYHLIQRTARKCAPLPVCEHCLPKWAKGNDELEVMGYMEVTHYIVRRI